MRKVIEVNGFVLAPFKTKGADKGRVLYSIYCVDWNWGTMQTIRFPGVRTMKRLSRTYLGCEYVQDDPVALDRFFLFYIDTGISREKRAAFLAAVTAHVEYGV